MIAVALVALPMFALYGGGAHDRLSTGGDEDAGTESSRFTPILVFCIAFGLSMDYEVFLLSRIKEEYDLERDNEHAVSIGLQKTGRIVTAAALLLTIVFVGIATSQVALVKAFGVGLGIAVLVDAFLVRATLVPAFMRLAGRLNWWSPRWLRQWHLRFRVWENEPIALPDRQFERRL
jgi:RND superfamily putative drug exporter